MFMGRIKWSQRGQRDRHFAAAILAGQPRITGDGARTTSPT
jgi:hypothetical protein